METDNRVFFTPGMVVKCTKLEDAPTMYVLKKKEYTMKIGESKSTTLQGIICRYLDKNGVFHDELFSTKDIIQI